jgi:hypothetical protein
LANLITFIINKGLRTFHSQYASAFVVDGDEEQFSRQFAAETVFYISHQWPIRIYHELSTVPNFG